VESFKLDNLTITIEKEGGCRYNKVSYPARYGRYAEVRHPDYLCQYNLRGEIKHIQGLDSTWPHPAEWLKRTVGNDWLYYASGGYSDVFDLVGEYYVPCFSYSSNSVFPGNPFNHPAVKRALEFWPELHHQISSHLGKKSIPPQVKIFLNRIINNNEKTLSRRAHTIQTIVKGRVPVLPPDTRHIDYEVIPLVIADGCLHNCGFCQIKTGGDFHPRPKSEVFRQVKELKEFYDKDLPNYNALFLGQHDGLAAGQDLISYAAESAYDFFQFDNSYIKDPRLFLFGSVDSFLNTDDSDFASLNKLPYYTYINLGLESADQATLDALRKPVSAKKVRQAFARMLEVNRAYGFLEVTANFLLIENSPPGHYQYFSKMMTEELHHLYSKGAVYLSPLKGFRDRKEIVAQFHTVRKSSKLPTYFYLIQRL
jgi:hypothetical protein